MDVDNQTVLGAMGGVCVFIGTMLKIIANGFARKVDKLEEQLKENEQALAAHRENAAEKYVTRAELSESNNNVMQAITRLDTKIDLLREKI